jgi:hypothetical protein
LAIRKGNVIPNLTAMRRRPQHAREGA